MGVNSRIYPEDLGHVILRLKVRAGMARETPSPRIRQYIVGGSIALVGILAIDFSRSKGLLIHEPLALRGLGIAVIILGAAVRIWCFIDLRSTWRIDHLAHLRNLWRNAKPHLSLLPWLSFLG